MESHECVETNKQSGRSNNKACEHSEDTKHHGGIKTNGIANERAQERESERILFVCEKKHVP